MTKKEVMKLIKLKKQQLMKEIKDLNEDNFYIDNSWGTEIELRWNLNDKVLISFWNIYGDEWVKQSTGETYAIDVNW